RNQRDASAISSRCPTTMRSHRARSDSLAPWDGAHPAIRTACAWWRIIPEKKWMSAAVAGGGARRVTGAAGAGAALRTEGVDVAHAASTTTARIGFMITARFEVLSAISPA